MKGYCLHIEGTNTYYEITHAEILGDMFNIRRILNIMRAANSIRERTSGLVHGCKPVPSTKHHATCNQVNGKPFQETQTYLGNGGRVFDRENIHASQGPHAKGSGTCCRDS